MGLGRAEEARGGGEVGFQELALDLIAHVRSARRGLWAKKKFEHPADYKKRMKLAEEGRSGEGGKAVASSSTGVLGFIKRIFGAR